MNPSSWLSIKCLTCSIEVNSFILKNLHTRMIPNLMSILSQYLKGIMKGILLPGVNTMENHWDERFKETGYLYGEEPNEFIKTHSNVFEKNSEIVAFAEGEGRNAVYLARLGHRLTTWDYSKNGLKKTKELADKFNVEVATVQKDLTSTFVSEHVFDGAFMVFGHFAKKDQKKVIDLLLKVVKPGGTVMFEVYSQEQIFYKTGGPKVEDMMYDPSDVLEWIKGYKVVHFFYGEQDRKEGTGHTGVGHVIQVIVKKETFKQ